VASLEGQVATLRTQLLESQAAAETSNRMATQTATQAASTADMASLEGKVATLRAQLLQSQAATEAASRAAQATTSLASSPDKTSGAAVAGVAVGAGAAEPWGAEHVALASAVSAVAGSIMSWIFSAGDGGRKLRRDLASAQKKASALATASTASEVGRCMLNTLIPVLKAVGGSAQS
jgi:hypothetical protein